MTLEEVSAEEALKNALKLYRKKLAEFLLKEELTEEDLRALKRLVGQLKDAFSRSLQETAQYLEEIAKKADAEELKFTVKRLKEEALSDLLNRLENQSRKFNRKEYEDLREKLDRSRFRIMELARVGRYDEVLYTLERIFFPFGEVPPPSLLEILSDSLHPAEVKKNAVYLFLAVVKPVKKEESHE